MAENNNLKETAANEQHNDESNGFAETISKSEAFISDHKKGLLIGTGAVLAVIAAFFLSKEFYFGPREIKASTELAKPQQLFNEGDFEKALKGDKGTPGFLSINTAAPMLQTLQTLTQASATHRQASTKRL